jgi:transaldolase
MMTMNRLQRLHAAGQSIWLDYIDRAMLHNGELVRRIGDDAITGMTSNPTIFEKAIAQGHMYDADLQNMPAEATAWEAFESLATTDVRVACDVFREVYDRTHGTDGFVSIEVSPAVANDADASVEEGRRLWATVDRPNVMIKVPGTAEGAQAARRLIADGVNVNVTLLFSLEAYARIIEAYLSGLEDRVKAGGAIDRVASVASFFVSRVDSEIDKRLDAMVKAGGPNAERAAALRGRAAIANAKRAYRLFQRSFAGPRWEALRARGAQLQRPLWASTSTKNPAYRDVIYVEELVGPDTVNTMPPATVDAFRDHGETRRTVDTGLEDADRAIEDLAAIGIAMDEVTAKLLDEGLASFQKSFDTLIAGLEGKSASMGREIAASRGA